jgi:hypothetical protein
MVDIIIKKMKRKKAKAFARHLEETHPSVRGKIKVRNTKSKIKIKSKGNKRIIESIKRQSRLVTNPDTVL